MSGSKAKRLIAWDRFVMLISQEDELCESPFANWLCQRRWKHHGLHAYANKGTTALWKLPA